MFEYPKLTEKHFFWIRMVKKYNNEMKMFEYPKLTEKHFFWIRIVNLLNKQNEKISFRGRTKK